MAEWLAGQRITAERLRESQGTWIDYDTAWSASTTAPSIGNGLLVGRHMRIGNTVEFLIRIVWGSTTSDGDGPYDFRLPQLPRSYGGASNIAGVASCIIEIGDPNGTGDARIRRYGLNVFLYSTGLVRIADNGESGAGIGSGGHAGRQWQTNNFLVMSGRYEAAT